MHKDLTLGKVCAYAVGFFLIGILFPIALGEIYGTNVTGWNASVVTVFQTVMPILALLGVAIDYIR